MARSQQVQLNNASPVSSANMSSMVSTEDLAKLAGFDIVKTKAWKAMNPSTSTEVSIRTDILRDFESESERARREVVEATHMQE